MQLKAEDPDWELIRAIAQGDARALERLYASYGPGLLVYLSGRLDDPHLAEEVLQDVMLAVWRAAPRFRYQSKLRTWLFAIARNRAINAYQRKRAPDHLPIERANRLSDSEMRPLDARQEKRSTLLEALQNLPRQQRETLELVFMHNFSIQETAMILDVAPGTVKSRLHRAKTALRQNLSDQEKADE
jgi:RNA polymerase sigma-70 factor (ECF subfamily)